MSFASVRAVEPVGGWPFISIPSVFTPSIAAGLVGSAVIMKKFGQVAASLNPACPSAPIGNSGLPSKQKNAFASESLSR